MIGKQTRSQQRQDALRRAQAARRDISALKRQIAAEGRSEARQIVVEMLREGKSPIEVGQLLRSIKAIGPKKANRIACGATRQKVRSLTPAEREQIVSRLTR